jgi:electron transport complex protein RnfE
MISEFTKGLVKENPIFIIMLGLCPTLAVSTQVVNALGMGAGVIFVLLGSNIFISLLKDFIPDKVRIPAFIVIIASFVTIVDLVMQAYAAPLARNLGVFVQLIVVNCIILGRAEAFASKNTVGRSFVDGLGMGLGFTFALAITASVREIIGTGKIWGLVLLGTRYNPVLVAVLSPGAFITLGLLIGLFNLMERKEG